MVTISASNRLNLNYREEASTFQKLPYGIIDVHSHIIGGEAAKVFKEAADLYGIETIFSMTPLAGVPEVRAVLGDRVKFIAVPNFTGSDRQYEVGEGYLDKIEAFHKLGSRIAKFWTAPRIVDFSGISFRDNPLRLTFPIRQKCIQAAVDLGMILMFHVGDPDTWFQSRYADSSKYGTKREHYYDLEETLARYSVPAIAAHMGGWPEDLQFLSELLGRHSNLHLDCSATKWMVRELSKHSREELLTFLTRWKGRILFGSDIVTSNAHLQSGEQGSPMDSKAASQKEAFDLYASRYWSLRKLFESDYDGESPIADPDLAMVAPDKFSAIDAPKLKGFNLPEDIIRTVYRDACLGLIC